MISLRQIAAIIYSAIHTTRCQCLGRLTIHNPPGGATVLVTAIPKSLPTSPQRNTPTISPRDQTLELCASVRNACTFAFKMISVELWSRYSKPITTHAEPAVLGFHGSDEVGAN